MFIKIEVPVISDISNAVVGSCVEISGVIYTARDAILPKLAKLIREGALEKLPVNLQGSAIMHTAFSPAGFGPTSSNKEEIESNMGLLSQAGVKLHIGKGILKRETIEEISKHGAIFVVVPPISAFFQSKLISKRVLAFEEEGMEALHELRICSLPGVVAAAQGKSIFYDK